MSGFLAEETLPWAHQCNKLHFTICIVLLSEFVSQNAWLQHYSYVSCQHGRDWVKGALDSPIYFFVPFCELIITSK